MKYRRDCKIKHKCIHYNDTREFVRCTFEIELEKGEGELREFKEKLRKLNDSRGG